MPLTRVEDTGGGRGEPKISLRKSGSIGINSRALDEFFEGAGSVNLFEDVENDKIGFEPVGNDSGQYAISRSESGGSVTPLSWLKRHDLIPDITTQYAPRTEVAEDETEVVVIDLNDPLGTYGSPDSEDSDE